MKLFQIVSVVLGTLIAISACSGGGGGRVIGSQCPKNYNPVVMDVKDKVALDADLPAGDYRYAGTEVYFVDTQTDMRVSVQDVEMFGGEWKVRVGCVRNAKIGMAALAVKTLGLSAMTVEASKKISTFDARAFGFKIEDGKLVADGGALPAEEKPASPKEVYDEGSAGERFLFNVADNRWEVRSTGTINGVQYQMVQRFDRVDPKPAKPTEEKPSEEKPDEEGQTTGPVEAAGG